MKPLTVVLGSRKDLPGFEFPQVSPLYPAFARMVRNLEFDVCELALATYLQARGAGVPITLIPAVMVGGTHHRSLTRLPDGPELTPGDLVGKRIGVRSYSQTTGLWVRGILSEEYGIAASDITWVTTEEPHVAQYEEPAWVTRSSAGRVADLLHRGDVAAAVLGPRAIGGQGEGLVPVIPDAEAAARAWVDRHGFVPVNHVVVVRDDVLRAVPDQVRELAQALGAGWSDELRACMELAARYALEQELLREPIDLDVIEKEATRLWS
ncbi:hypothetical protein [Planomonospora venezuelensis]|uniref:4,5-dihydroxyphthalate decarboxylase n=1 Tax=Planomonospora venezuelensis TaxID=1999 RepID=A0A841DGD1_PLAVE|nr:hypothetical protein [Planomonospora venezuelensis]MBB5967358.1 4,5-dihydroxyphthalate decarboxylase [Planomonospora venezuelensis]GIN03126.1 hypothetical protein Pve01_47840 [Planomonospora venezuelensis]